VSRDSPLSWLALGAVAVLQTAALAWIVYGRVSLLNHGREIVVEVIPVDPRDLFRGDYVIFGYPFSQTGEVDVPDTIRQGDAVYVTLKSKGGDAWEMVNVDAAYPAAVAHGNVVLKGFASQVWKRDAAAKPTASLRYGIESYFVPEGTGRKLEELVRDKKIAAVLAVGKAGDAAIKALMIDGKRVVEEPLL
jgi:uncharacterized membrane-anchored protein